ncbi:MAG TPA: glycosyl transferase group 1 [Cyanobacteria bacterium UBA11149]|nr:glycosyl transferase group 1 [Cyanobacteria bacterium UBA11367]HBE59968.1 glycosyl transferase group 1 [Cyanobacteria bacterium UBA11366]HBK63994.1 glycosyl transferase group 1 [Cyanobacteria bacterium UBA11166]HBR74383.1 glycosyl transferase group 1 [Cyanobacteria bacterium UBA11159]HBS68339.1 glycosyl transferase group 1 [Cyanobacteria bacterium UBA11153]HBW87379.1 glycosyl transferase group 1 [Cyanobacteria bacterium UBA11149]HCA97235.1 glycosyl transferase group 1 [Cyanobacteria bacter
MIQKISILAPDLSGGGGTRAYLLGQVLQQLNYDVKVCGFLFGQSLYPLPPENLPVWWVAGGNYPEFLNSAKNLLKEIDGEIIYAIKPRPTSFGIALFENLRSHKPIILDIDDWELSWFGEGKWRYRPTINNLVKDLLKSDGQLRSPDHWLYLQWMEKLINRANAVTVDTQFLKHLFGGTYLPNGKDTDLFDPSCFNPEASRAKYGLSEYRVLMFPGTARPHKGIEDVLFALDRLNQPDLRLVLVGGREIGDGYIEKLMDIGKRWIVKLPSTPIDKMPEIVSAAHIVVVPQRDKITAQAQFPIKLTDGMAMAKPIISTRVGDIPEILADTGYLVAPSCPEQIAETIKGIFDNFAAATTRGMKARERCIDRYSISTMSGILSKVISDL